MLTVTASSSSQESDPDLERLKENLQQVSLPAGIEGSLLLLRNYE
jgi:hypothetical protein